MRRLTVLLVAAVIAGACGGGSSSTSGSPGATAAPSTIAPTATTQSPDSAETLIGPDGGVAASPDGTFRVEIPAGALDAEIGVAISEPTADEVGANQAAAAGGIYSVGPDDQTFSTPVTVVQTIDAASVGAADGHVPFFTILQRSGGVWSDVHATTRRVGSKFEVAAQVTSFSIFFVVATGDMKDLSVRIVMAPGAFIREVGDSEDGMITSVEGAEVGEWFSISWFGDPGLDVEQLNPFDARLTCREDGEHEYEASLTTTVDVYDKVNPFESRRETEFIATAVGLATCVTPAAPDPGAFLGRWQGPLAFVPVSGGPPGSPYEAPFIFEISEGDEGLVVRTEQLPSSQIQLGIGMIVDGNLFFAVSGQGSSWSELLVGRATRSGGGLLIDAFTTGGPAGTDYQDSLSSFYWNPANALSPDEIDALVIESLDASGIDAAQQSWLHRATGTVIPE